MESAILDARILDASTNSVFILADTYRKLREKKSDLEDAIKKLNADIELVEEQLTDLMITEENSKFTRRDKTFYLTEKLYVSSLADKREKLYQGLRDNGMGDMVKEYVFPSALKALVREQLEESDALPPWMEDCISYFRKPAIGMRKK